MSSDVPVREAKRVRTPSLSLRPALVDAGTRLLMRGQQLTIRGVAVEAGVAPMSVYNQFGSKDELIVAVVAEAFEDLADRLLANEGQDPLTALRAAGGAFRQWAVESPERYRLVWGYANTLGEGSAFGAMVKLVSNARESGVPMRGSSKQIAANLWACVRGGVSMEMDFGDSSDFGFDFDALLDMILDAFIRPY